jgi:hypothetical protein
MEKNLYENVMRLKLNVQQIPLHGRVATIEDLRKALADGNSR